MYINPAIIEIRNKSSVSNPRSSERRDGAFFLGIQWHPEISYEFDEDSRKIIDTFIKVCEGKSLEQ